MRIGNRILLILLAAVLALSGCTAAAEPTDAPTEAVTEPAAVPTESVEATEPGPALVSEAELPKRDLATGTLMFYVDGKGIYAGGPVSDLLDGNVYTHYDVSQEIQPGHISAAAQFRLLLPGVAEEEQPFLYVAVINTGKEPLPYSECLIYAISVNCSAGIPFGSGNEKKQFVTMETTEQEILDAYGVPTYDNISQRIYREIAYYKPFNCAYFAFKNGVVRQIMTYYSANLYDDLAKEANLKLDGYFGSDAYILMSQYMDVKPYMDEEKSAKRKETVCKNLSEFITLSGKIIIFGGKVEEMPDEFSKPFEELKQYLDRNHYFRTGKNNPEEFYVINYGDMRGLLVKNATVKGVITQNCGYTNWGMDCSAFHEFEYQGLKYDATIEDVLKLFGQPQELQATSNAKACFVWLHYKDKDGNTLRLCVDPMLDQIIELRAAKFFKGERPY